MKRSVALTGMGSAEKSKWPAGLHDGNWSLTTLSSAQTLWDTLTKSEISALLPIDEDGLHVKALPNHADRYIIIVLDTGGQWHPFVGAERDLRSWLRSVVEQLPIPSRFI
jgi:hypothetical protein